MQTKDVKAIVDQSGAASDGDRETYRVQDQILQQLQVQNELLQKLLTVVCEATGIKL